ncbi:MAG: outer membrane beta-barrel family protein [Muribaculaceae bacterium]|nr:outer membrane beta-barrel family protein [Muribaculaceae bacterium]
MANPEYPERLYLTWGNQGKDRNFYAHADGNIDITEWWNFYAGVTYVLTAQKLALSDPYDTFSYIRLVASTVFRLPGDFNLTLNCFYNSRMKIGNITVYPILNVNPTLQKKFGRYWTMSLSVENMLQRKNRIRATSSGFDRLGWSDSHAAVKIGITYQFKSGRTFRAPRVEKNTDGSRFMKE